MDPKVTTLGGAAMLIVGLLLTIRFWTPFVWTVVAGCAILLLVLAGALFLLTGAVQVREDRAAAQREQEQQQHDAAMAAQG